MKQILLFLALVAIVTAEGGQRKPISVDDAGVVAAADYFVGLQNQAAQALGMGERVYTLVQIASAEYQIVTGKKYFLTVALASADERTTADVVVLKSLGGTLAVLDSTLVRRDARSEDAACAKCLEDCKAVGPMEYQDCARMCPCETDKTTVAAVNADGDLRQRAIASLLTAFPEASRVCAENAFDENDENYAAASDELEGAVALARDYGTACEVARQAYVDAGLDMEAAGEALKKAAKEDAACAKCLEDCKAVGPMEYQDCARMCPCQAASESAEPHGTTTPRGVASPLWLGMAGAGVAVLAVAVAVVAVHVVVVRTRAARQALPLYQPLSAS